MHTSSKRSNWLFKVALVAIGLAVGLWLGVRLTTAAGTIMIQVQRIYQVMNLIQSAYVEEPNLDRLADGAIEGMLERLDPHSVYIPPADQTRIAEVDEGEFEGIGISFVIQNELITVIAPIPGTPAERLGIRSGDRVIEIDGVSAYGITNDEVFQKVRGPAGTTVNLKIAREGVSESLDFTIVRAKIPIHSVLASFMLDDSTGYILLNQFTATSENELQTAIRDLDASGMTRLIFDLRNNQGGRLSQAVSTADMFIPGGHILVSRKGRQEDENAIYRSTNSGTFPLYNLIILINSGSASASEIVAGAVQDLDRGLIVGENSFGKGLVQRQFMAGEGAVIRISTSHWYTPTGRLVQRPYDKGRGEYYAVRYRDPDSLSADSTREAFRTLGGRTVYASSGITPDHKIEERRITRATIQLLNNRLLFEYAQTIAVNHNLTEESDFQNYYLQFETTDDDIEGLLELASERELEYPPEALESDREYLKSQLKAEVAQLVWSNREDYYLIRTANDPVVRSALELFEEANNIASVWR